MAILTQGTTLPIPTMPDIQAFKSRLGLCMVIYTKPEEVLTALKNYFPGRDFSAEQKKNGEFTYAVRLGQGIYTEFYFELN